MSVEFAKVKKSTIRTMEDTPGGTTYFVILPDQTVEKKICFRPMKKHPELRCVNVAGKETNHLGYGACNLHGGAKTDHITIKTGRFAGMSHQLLREKVNSYMSMDRARLLDLTDELAVAKAMFDMVVENFPDSMDDDYKVAVALNRFHETLNTLSNTVERISRVENRNTLTAAQVLYLRATVADILMKYLPDPRQRELAARELATRMGGDIEVELHPYEITAVS